MLITFRKKYGLKIAEVYFPEHYQNELTGVDLIIYLHALKPQKGGKELSTLHLDLTQDEEKIFSQFHKNTKRNIKAAVKKAELKYFISYNPKDEEIKEFSVFFNIFARNKKIGKCNLAKLKALRAENALALSVIRDKDLSPLCYHAYINGGKYVRILYSASHFRLAEKKEKTYLIARANRHLHWLDMKAFKARGCEIYDFGGLALDPKNEVLQNIDRFKLGFGGKIVAEYAYYQPLTCIGKLAVLAHNRRLDFLNSSQKK